MRVDSQSSEADTGRAVAGGTLSAIVAAAVDHEHAANREHKLPELLP